MKGKRMRMNRLQRRGDWYKAGTGILFLLLLLFLLPSGVLAADQAQLTIPGVGVILTGDTPEMGERFTVTLAADGADDPMPEGQTGGSRQITLGAGESGSFGAITYTQLGEYSYTMIQEAGSASGYTYDTTVYHMLVQVTRDEDDNWSCKVVIHKGDPADKFDTFDFCNSYKKSPAADTGTLTISKEVAGTPPKAETFAFTIKLTGTGSESSYIYTDETGDRLGTIRSGDQVELAGGDAVILRNLPVGINYQIMETSKAHYIPTPISGVIEGTIEQGGASAAFLNTYDANRSSPVSIDPPVTKQVKGDKPKQAGTFRFQLIADTQAMPMPEGTKDGARTIEIRGEGTKELGWITYTSPGVYTYRIVEVVMHESGYTYDKAIYQMTVTVTDKDGRLTTFRTLEKDGKSYDKDAALFVNSYSKDTKTAGAKTPGAKTGDEASPGGFAAAGVAAVLIMVGTVAAGRRRGKYYGKKHR